MVGVEETAMLRSRAGVRDKRYMIAMLKVIRKYRFQFSCGTDEEQALGYLYRKIQS
jgi:hypothetical protein